MATSKVTRILLCFFLLLSAVSFGQSATPKTQIPGAVTGAQVPDSVAYRMVFLSLSLPTNPTKANVIIQQSVAQSIGMNSGDTTLLLLAVEGFKQRHVERADQVGSSMVPTARDFRTQRDGDVQSIRDVLKNSLSADGMKLFDAYVAGEKANIETVIEPNN